MKLQPRRRLVITNCTGRKRRAAGGPVVLAKKHYSSLSSLAQAWRKQLGAAREGVPLGELYVGRGFSEASRVAAIVGAEMWVVSAGLGLRPVGEVAPNYDLTISYGPSSIEPFLQKFSAASCDWWKEIATSPSLAELVNDAETETVLIASPASYLAMVRVDLEDVHAGAAEKLRIFTSAVGARHVPAHLAKTVMPYDERLESSTHSGTRSDFPQRALRHFVESLHAHHLPLSSAHAAVQRALTSLPLRRAPTRSKRSDEEICDLIRQHWVACDGKCSSLLRHFRDTLLISCEQARFSQLWRSVRDKGRP